MKEMISKLFFNSLGFSFSILMHSVALIFFLKESPSIPKTSDCSVIEVSFVRTSTQAKELFMKNSEKTHKMTKGFEKSSLLFSDYSRSQKKMRAAPPVSVKQIQHHNTVKTISNNRQLESISGSQKKMIPSFQQGGEIKASPPRYRAGSLENPLPNYPYVSRRRGEEGKVTCSVKVSPEGRPEQIEIKKSSGYERLDRAAQKVLSSWFFQPAQKDFEKIYGFLEISITFRLTEGVKI